MHDHETTERLIRMEGQLNRIVADIESEKEFRKMHNDRVRMEMQQMRKDITDIQRWQSKWSGALITLSIISGILGIVSIIMNWK